QILQRIGHALQKMWLSLVKSPEAVSPQCLHDAYIYIGVIVLHECAALDLHIAAQAFEIIIEQLLPQRGRQIGLAVEEQRSNVILQRAPSPALIIEKPRLSAAQHDVARLK